MTNPYPQGQPYQSGPHVPPGQTFPPGQQVPPGAAGQPFPPGQSGFPPGQPGFPVRDAGGRPKEVDFAFALMLVSFVIASIAYVVGATRKGGLFWSLFSQLRHLLRFSAHAVEPLAVVSTIVYGVIAYGLWLFLTLQLRAGRNWARVTLAIVGGLSLLGAMGSLVLDFFGRLKVIPIAIDAGGLLARILAVVAIFLAFRPLAARYFTRR